MTSARRKLERQQRKQREPAGSRGEPSKVTALELSELRAILARAKAGPLDADEVDKLEAAMDTLAFLTRELEAKGASIHRLRRMLFGPSTEKTSQVSSSTGDAAAATPAADATAAEPSTVTVVPSESGSRITESQQTSPPDTTASTDTNAPTGDSSTDEPKRKGHGRNPASAYRGAERVSVSHESLHDKQSCPDCQRGKLYLLPPPAQLVRVRGMAPLHATVYELDRLRCNLCGEVFTARAPEGIGS